MKNELVFLNSQICLGFHKKYSCHSQKEQKILRMYTAALSVLSVYSNVCPSESAHLRLCVCVCVSGSAAARSVPYVPFSFIVTVRVSPSNSP